MWILKATCYWHGTPLILQVAFKQICCGGCVHDLNEINIIHEINSALMVDILQDCSCGSSVILYPMSSWQWHSTLKCLLCVTHAQLPYWRVTEPLAKSVTSRHAMNMVHEWYKLIACSRKVITPWPDASDFFYAFFKTWIWLYVYVRILLLWIHYEMY